MKITVDVDCSPEEARAFLGLPDVKPLQDRMMTEIAERMTANVRAMDAQEMMKFWMPGGLNGLEQLQSMFAQMTGLKPK